MSSEAVVPATVQTVGVAEEKLTASPEVDVAERAICVAAIWPGAMAGNMMVCVVGGLAVKMPSWNGPTELLFPLIPVKASAVKGWIPLKVEGKPRLTVICTWFPLKTTELPCP